MFLLSIKSLFTPVPFPPRISGFNPRTNPKTNPKTRTASRSRSNIIKFRFRVKHEQIFSRSQNALSKTFIKENRSYLIIFKSIGELNNF